MLKFSYRKRGNVRKIMRKKEHCQIKIEKMRKKEKKVKKEGKRNSRK